VEARLAGARPAPSAADVLASHPPLLTRCEVVQADGAHEQYLRLVDTMLGEDVETMLVEVPSNFQAIKRCAGDDAQAWRGGTRSVFTDLFARGYAALDFVVDARPGALTRCYYVVGRLESIISADS
jgi:predicted GNAT superfamily acetyltransferase